MTVAATGARVPALSRPSVRLTIAGHMPSRPVAYNQPAIAP